MFKFDNKGQSSSVFNLLIAALVSLAILGLLLSVLGGIGFNSGKKPIDTTINLVKDAMNTPFSLRSETVTFTKTENSIPAKSVSQKTDVSDALTFLTCNDPANVTADAKNGITFKGTSNQQNKVFVMCGEGIVSTDFTFPTTVGEGCGSDIQSDPKFMCYVIITPQVG